MAAPVSPGWQEPPATTVCQRHQIYQLIRAAFGFRPGSHYTAMIYAYFDESGDPADSPVVSVAAVVSTEQKWCAFEEQWGEVLGRYQVSGLHMKDYAHSKGEFKGWTQDKQRAFIRELLPILFQHVELGIGCSIPMNDWKAVMLDKLGPKLQKQGTRLFLLRCCLDAIQLAPSLSQNEPIACIFEHNPKFVGQSSEVFGEWNEEMEQRDRFVSFTSMKKGVAHALEAADLLAYEGRKEVFEGYVKTHGLPQRKLYESLDEHTNVSFVAFPKEALEFYLKSVFPHLLSGEEAQS